MTVENENKLRRIVKFTSAKSFYYSLLFWKIATYSIIIDLIVFNTLKIQKITFPEKYLYYFIIIGIIAGCSAYWSKLYLKFHTARSDFFKKIDAKFLPILIIIPILAGTLLDVFNILNRVNIITLSILFIFLFGALVTILKEIKTLKESEIDIYEDKTFWIQKGNFAIFIIHVVPVFLLRVALIAALFIIKNEIHLLTLWCAIGFLLLIHKPVRDAFMQSCKKCSFLTSIILQPIGICPACTPEQFYVSLRKPTENLVPDSNTPSPKQEKISKGAK